MKDSDREKLDDEFLQYIAYGESYFLEKKMLKRSPYTMFSNNKNSNGEFVSDKTKNAFMNIAKNKRILLSLINTDGGCFFDRDTLSTMTYQQGPNAGKLILNTSIGGFKKMLGRWILLLME